MSALLKQGTAGFSKDPVPQVLPGGALKEQSSGSARELGLHPLPQEWPCLPQPPQKGLGMVLFPQKMNFMEVFGFKVG